MSSSSPEAKVWKDPWHFIAFGAGLGTMKFAPGTWGTLGGVYCYYLMHDLSLWNYLLLMTAMFLFGIWLCGKVAAEIGIHDYKGIVWDEVVGYVATMVAAPYGLKWMVLGFVLFRVFDILKPWPIRYFDKHCKGGLGIMLDDLLAAIPAWIILQLIYHFS